MNLRVLYLFAGQRRKLYEEYKKGKASDIHLIGFNHMANYGIEVTFLENRLTEFLRRISFNLTQLPVLFRLKSCDVIFSADAIMSPSLAQQDFLRSIGFPAEKNYYVPYGIDHDFYDKDKRVSEVQESYIFSSGRDVGRDYKTLIEAVRDL